MGEAKDLMIGIVLFGMVITGLALFTGDLFNSYSVNDTSVGGLSRFQNISDSVSNLRAGISTQSPKGGSNDIFLEVVTGGLAALGTIAQLPGIASDVLTASNDAISLSNGTTTSLIPEWFINGVGLIIGIIIILLILRIILKTSDI